MPGAPRPLVAVLGASGATGRAAAGRLAATGRVRLRLGARDAGALAAPAAALGAEAVGVDAGDADALAGFCAGAAVVVQCAGPSLRLTPAVLAAALAAGAHLVDPAGDLDPFPTGDRCVVLGTGVVPGLSGLLPRLLPPGARRLDLYAGGADRLTPAAAADVLLSVPPRYGLPRALWRDGGPVEAALAVQPAVSLPGFDGPVHAVPLLTAEAQRLAADTGAEQLRAYSVFPGPGLPDTLASAWASGDPLAHVDAVIAAADADVAAHGVAITLLASARYADGARRTLLRSTDSLALTGAFTALAVTDVLAGRVPHGVGRAAEVLDPVTTAARLAADPSVDELRY
ncbi:saccharopine dehydrogenase NADP-binding domain-containing protein [Pseudonocardia alni]|uniref:Saccharopine dehydrogenase NADP binding domain-containing protein n=1 Tax=Pseudonocardia alni TaxID=33907 RepID=A0A852VXQ7_PSEA5|nr:saccharopine dehydrogenase NADP-binding domain-containing protein [Pseudonocardia antarctica]NYG00810.1 hypothetical protein [Pseudonocardia antarctica]